MRNITICFYLTLLTFLFSGTQSVSFAQIGYEAQDTILRGVSLVDSSYLNKNIFSIISEPSINRSKVTIKQSPHIAQAVYNQILNASLKKVNGYRIRVFFDNKQDARAKSQALEQSIPTLFPGVGVYRTYDNPYFKVTIGDYRSRSDAMRMLRRVEGLYPTAFIVREPINFPPLEQL
ncbi:MAG: SPOR domain-containing protein [Bacteroidales bacterium]|jgi:hypothetical protein|nr:SPOR domain-containing protein [Bacteroidales bacterium]